ncbi:Integrase catalytic region [mine drainage metagenome]|uniref:Integrase catalytic region n=1 Tax=mine drainage metagenome TaxID=410659 RepID=T0ZYW6_9ZZZZ
MIDPYLLEGVSIEQPHPVWATDISYLPMTHGFLYLMAILNFLMSCLDQSFRSDFDVRQRYGITQIFLALCILRLAA